MILQRRSSRLLFTAVALSVALTSCAGGGASGSGQGGAAAFDPAEANREGALVVGTRLSDFTLDPVDTTGLVQLTMLAPIYDTMLRIDPDGEIEPGIITDYRTTDPQTVLLTVRPGVTFSDGTPVDAEAIRANLLRMRDAKSGELNAVLQQITDITATSPSEVQVALASPVAGEFVQSLWGAEGLVVSPAQFANPDVIDTAPIGAGPYRVVEYIPNQRLVLERRDDHWDAANWPVKRITEQHVMDGPPAVTALSSGDIELARSYNATVLESLRNNSSIGIAQAPGTVLQYVNFCKNRAPFDDPTVREAFAAAVDRESIKRSVTADQGAVAYQAWPEDSPNFNADAVTRFDPERARQLLAGRTVPMELAYNVNLIGAERSAEIMQAQLQDVGFQVTLRGLETQEAMEASVSTWMTGSSLGGVQKIARQIGPNSLLNVCGYSSPEATRALADIQAALPGTPESTEAWKRAAELIDSQTLFMPLTFQVALSAFDNDTVNAQPTRQTFTDFRSIYVK